MDFLLYLLFLGVLLLQISSSADAATVAVVPHTPDIVRRFDALSFSEGYSTIWGQPKVLEDDGKVELILDKHSGSGFMSVDDYYYGFFSASIKLPKDYTAGVVIAFYTSNADAFPNNHDELDFEFLGNIRGRPWRMQTNIYGNGSIPRGREERFNFWFDPTEDFHQYSILWNHEHIVFMVDNIPIREMTRTNELGGDYPSKPMALYATIWDGSGWATDGGKYPLMYKYAPFVATFKDMKLDGCATNPLEGIDACKNLELINPVQNFDLLLLGADQQVALDWVRKNHMYYSYCDDRNRYPYPLPECEPRTSATDSNSTITKKKKSSHHHSSKSSTHSRTRGRTLIDVSSFISSETVKFSIPPSLQIPSHTKIKKVSKH